MRRERREADHAVAAPIGKPVITGDHGPSAPTLTLSRERGRGNSHAAGDPELFAGDHQLPRQRMLARGIRQGVLPPLGRVPGGRQVPSHRGGIGTGQDDHVGLSVELHLDRPGREQVLLVVETAVAFGSMQDPPVPIGAAADDRRRAHVEVRANPRGVDDPTVGALRHVEAALAVSLRVMVAVSKEWPQLQHKRWAGQQAVGQDRARDTVLHPDPFFDEAAVNRPAKAGQHAVDIHPLQQAEPIRVDGPVPVLLGRKWVAHAIGSDDPFLDGSQQHHPLDGRIQRGNEQTVIAASVHPGHRSRCVTAEPVRHQPLAADGTLDVSTDLRIEVERHSAQVAAIVRRVLMSSGRRSSAAVKSSNGTRRVISRSKMPGHCRSACWKCWTPISK